MAGTASSVFDEKIFNGQVFKGYVDRVPNTKRKELIKSKAIRQRPDLAKRWPIRPGATISLLPSGGLSPGANRRTMTVIPICRRTAPRHSGIPVWSWAA